MSEVGTIPDNEDKRPLDLVGDQVDRRASTDPFSSVENRGPALPVVNIPTSFEDSVREVATSAFRDLLRNVTVNGLTPDISGGQINFAVPTQPPASVQFSSLNPVQGPIPVFQSTASTPAVATQPIPAGQNNWMAIDREDKSRWDADANRPVYGLKENRKEGESYSDQVTREDKEFQSQRRAQRDADTSNGPTEKRRSGEGEKAYTSRINEDRADAFNESQASAVKSGDTSYFYKGYVPVLVTRADGARKILVRIDNSTSSVIEGAGPGERTGTLPANNAYYVAGGDETCLGLQVYLKEVNNTTTVRVGAGVVAGQSIDDQQVGTGVCKVYANVFFDSSTGEISSSSVATSEQGDANLILGEVIDENGSLRAINYDCGSVYSQVCRIWFKSPITYSLSLSR